MALNESSSMFEELLYGHQVVIMIGSEDTSPGQTYTYEGSPQKWRSYQCWIAEALELPHWKDYKAVLCEKYPFTKIPTEDRTISCLLEHMSAPHSRARFFFEEAIPIILDDGPDCRGKPRYCTAEETAYLRDLIQTAIESPVAEQMPEWAAELSKRILDLCGYCETTGSCVVIKPK